MLYSKVKRKLLISAVCTNARLFHYTKSNRRILQDEVTQYKSKQRFDDEGEEIGTRFRSHRRDGWNSNGNNTLTNSSNDAINLIQTEKKGFYDAATNFCELCQETLEASYRGHSECNEHTSRTGIYERAIELIDKYIEHLMQVNVRRDHMSSRRSSSTHSNSSSNGSRNKGINYNHYNNAQNDLTRMFAFFDQALPYDTEIIRSEPSLLENVDLLSILIDYWWHSINYTTAAQDLNDAMRFTVGSCASYLKDIQETDSAYDFRERSFVQPKADEHIKNVDFDRIPSLSSSNMTERKWRICFLLNFLRERGILRNSLQIGSANEEMINRQQSEQHYHNIFMLSERFERAEMVGDEVMKAMMFDRLARMFPLHECGGINEELYLVLRLIDCNHGLLMIYDYLDLDRLLQMRLPNSKSKSDVVEAIFGELECWLSSSEVACGVERFSIDPSPEFRYVSAIVKHTLNELGHVVVMWEVEQTLRNVSSFVKSHIVHSPILRMTKRTVSNHLRDEERDRAPHDLLPLLTKVKRVQPMMKDTGKSAWACAQELSETYQSKITTFEQTLNESPTLNSVELGTSIEYPTTTTTTTAAAAYAQHKNPLLFPYCLPIVLNKKNFNRNACKLLQQVNLIQSSLVDSGKDEQHPCNTKVTAPPRTDNPINVDNNNLSKNSIIDCAKLSTGAQRYKAWRQSEIDRNRREMTSDALRNLQLPQIEVSKLLSNHMIALSSSMQSNKPLTLPDFSVTQ